MSTTFLLLIAGIGIIGSAAFIFYGMKSTAPKQDYRSLMGSGSDQAAFTTVGIQRTGQASKKKVNIEDLERLKEEKGRVTKRRQKETLDSRLLKAGVFSKKEQEFYRKGGPAMALIMGVVLLVVLSVMTTLDMALLGTILGALVGFRVPSMLLDRKIERRAEEILYYLPLVIEQISIGVSSSLDIGPCLGVVVKMADERNSHNPVTELIKHVQFFVKSGSSLEEALEEVGTSSGHTELGHTFASLGQVSKHGGEISKQMQELADAVSSLRETKVEERIRTLELKATAPVALVFVGFMIVLVAGFFIQIKVGMAQ